MLLTIDPSSHIGWTLGPLSADAGIAQIRIGTKTLDMSTDMGVFLGSADDPIRDLFAMGSTAWAIEVPNTQRSYHAAIMKNVSLYGHIFYWARHFGMPKPTIFSPSELKLALTGLGNAKKEDMIAAAKRLGHTITNDHEADAIAIRRAYLFGVPDTKSEREKKAAAARRAAKEAAKAAAKGPNLL